MPRVILLRQKLRIRNNLGQAQNKRATFNKAYTTKNGAMNFIRKAIKENKFECVMLRENKEWLLNDDNNCLDISTPIWKYEIA